jgi:hypothetical protein
MSMDCCAVVKQYANGQPACPSCGTIGRVVGDKTIQAILEPAQTLSLLAVGRRFCGTPSCEIVYYGYDGRSVTKSEVPIRVGCAGGAGSLASGSATPASPSSNTNSLNSGDTYG